MKKRNFRTKKNKRSTLIAVLSTVLLVGGLGAMTSGFKDWTFKSDEPISLEKIMQRKETGDVVSTEGIVLGYVTDTNNHEKTKGLLIVEPSTQKMISVQGFTDTYPNYKDVNEDVIMIGDRIQLNDVTYYEDSTEDYVASSSSVMQDRAILEVTEDSTIEIISSRNNVKITEDVRVITDKVSMLNAFLDFEMYDVVKFVATEESPLYVGQSSATASDANAFLHFNSSASDMTAARITTKIGESTAERLVAVTKYDTNIDYFGLNKTSATAKAKTYTDGELIGVVTHVTPSYVCITPINEITLA